MAQLVEPSPWIPEILVSNPTNGKKFFDCYQLLRKDENKKEMMNFGRTKTNKQFLKDDSRQKATFVTFC